MTRTNVPHMLHVMHFCPYGHSDRSCLFQGHADLQEHPSIFGHRTSYWGGILLGAGHLGPWALWGGILLGASHLGPIGVPAIWALWGGILLGALWGGNLAGGPLGPCQRLSGMHRLLDVSDAQTVFCIFLISASYTNDLTNMASVYGDHNVIGAGALQCFGWPLESTTSVEFQNATSCLRLIGCSFPAS